MMRRGLTYGVCVVLMVLLSRVASAANLSDFLAGTYTEPGTLNQLPYRLFVPLGYDPAKEYPLVLFLHGAGEREKLNGDGRNTSQVNGNIDNLLAHLKMPQYSAFLLAPQVKEPEDWSSYSEEPSDPLRMTLSVMQQLEDQYSIDTSRLYVTGLSMGGNGTWEAMWQNPGLFAAGVPICGWGDPSKASLLVDQPLWAFHNVDDKTMPITHSSNMIDAIEAAGGDPLHTYWPTGGHNAWTKAYADDEGRGLYDWLFSQSLQDAPAVPEASTVALLAIGAPSVLLLARRRRQRS